MEGDDKTRIASTIRNTYRVLMETRNRQLKYMTGVRQKNNERFAFVLTPDLILQYNYVHQLMKSFHNRIPVDMCVQDGGIMCSNLSALTLDDNSKTTGGQLESFPAQKPPDNSDYVASRIVDLLDHPITDADQSLTLNVRDEFAANIATLNLLFEERYKMCQEQGERLKTELVSVKKQLAVSRMATSGTVDTRDTAADQTIERLRNQIAQYEMQLRAVRQKTEALQEINETYVERIQGEVNELMRRFNEPGKIEHGDVVVRLLQKLFDNLENERDRVVSTIESIQSVNDRRSMEFNSLLQRIGNVQTPEGFENRIQEEAQRRTAEIERQYNKLFKTRSDLDDTFQDFITNQLQQLNQFYESEIAKNNEQTEKLCSDKIAELEQRIDAEVIKRLGVILESGVTLVDEQGAVQVDTKEQEIARLKDSLQTMNDSLTKEIEANERLRHKISDLERRTVGQDNSYTNNARVEKLQSEIKTLEEHCKYLQKQLDSPLRGQYYNKLDVEKRQEQINNDKVASKLSEQSVAFRSHYNELASYVIKLLTNIKRWTKSGGGDVNKLLALVDSSKLKDYFKKCDAFIGYGKSPSPPEDVTELAQKVRQDYTNQSSKTKKKSSTQYRPAYGRSQGIDRWVADSP